MKKVANIITTGSMVMFLGLLSLWLFNTQLALFPFAALVIVAYIISVAVYNRVEGHINRKEVQK